MATQVIVLLPIGKRYGQDTLLSATCRAQVNRALFPKRLRFPTQHSGGCCRHPVLASAVEELVTTDLLPALPAEQLTLTRGRLMPPEAVSYRTVTFLFEDASHYTERCVL